MSDSRFSHPRSIVYHQHSDFVPRSGPLPYRLTNDYLFRASLQTNPLAAKGLICALLDLNPDDVLSCNILNPIILGEHLEEKDCVLDVRLLLNNQTQINLEMQVELLKNWQNRSIYYLSRMFTDLKKGQDYLDASPSIHIGILTRPLFPDSPCFYSKNYLMDTQTHHLYSGNFGIHVLDLSQIDQVPEEERTSELYNWARLLSAVTWEEVFAMAEKSDTLESMTFTLKELTDDEKVKLQCEARERYYADRRNALMTGREEGREEGRQEGRQEGQNSVIKLYSLLKEQNRLDDFNRCLTDSDYLHSLLEEFHLI